MNTNKRIFLSVRFIPPGKVSIIPSIYVNKYLICASAVQSLVVILPLLPQIFQTLIY